MNINMEKNADTLIFKIEGSIDTVTAPILEQELNDNISDINNLILDFEKVDYISSAGLRVLMIANQEIEDKGELTLKNVNEDVLEVFEMTGFDEILNIEG